MIIKKNLDEIQNFLSDASNYKGFCNEVFFPQNKEELVGIVKELNRGKRKITISGNGTGITGSRVPEGGTVISLEKLNRVLELNREKKFIRLEPGAILKDVQDLVEAENLFHPVDPTERNCFVGGTVATNASGSRTFKYGSTREYVVGLKIVLPAGDVINLERGKLSANKFDAKLEAESGKIISFKLPDYKMPNTKNAAGYFCHEGMDLIDLFIGAEGTLGVITEIKLRLLDLPKEILSCVVFFGTENDALNFIDEARGFSKQNPANIIAARSLEYFDDRTLNFLRGDYPNIPPNISGAVWFEQEIIDNEDEASAAWIKLINKHNANENRAWIAIDKKEREKFKDFRHAASWKVNEYIASKGLKKVGTDVAVPVSNFRNFLQWMKKIVESAELEYIVYGHFGDCHPHLNMLPVDESEYKTAKEIYSKICEEAVRLNGTVSAEHGIGKLKREYLLLMYGEEAIKEMAKLKLVFDPNKILNIGNIFDEKYLEKE